MIDFFCILYMDDQNGGLSFGSGEKNSAMKGEKCPLTATGTFWEDTVTHMPFLYAFCRFAYGADGVSRTSSINGEKTAMP